MKQFLFLFLNLLLVLVISACNNSKPINKVENNNTILGTLLKKGEGQGNNINISKIQRQETFYGEWQIEKVVGHGTVLAYDEEDIKKIIGKKITYTPDLAKMDDNLCKGPLYEKVTISKKEFESSNHVSFDSLGIKSESIIEIIIYTGDNHKNIWDSIASMFFIKDNNTLILFDGGVYFQLDRVK